MKAQFWSFDVIFAIVIFSSALLLLTLVWLDVSNQFGVSYGFGTQIMQAQLQSLQNRLLLPGSPLNWNSAVNVLSTSTWANVSAGLGTGSGSQLSVNKIMTLMAMSSYNTTTYQSTKTLLGVGYDYYILINASNFTMGMGLAPYSYKPYAIQVARQSAVLNGVPVKMQVILWTNKSFGIS